MSRGELEPVLGIAVTVALGKLFFKQIDMHPVPVPMSKIFRILFFVTDNIKSTNSSVSGLGTSTFELTIKGRS